MFCFQGIELKILKDWDQHYFWAFKTIEISSQILKIVLVFWKTFLIKNYENKWDTIEEPESYIVHTDLFNNYLMTSIADMSIAAKNLSPLPMVFL